MSPEVEAMTPAQRLTKGLCPECGVDLSRLDVSAHRDGHWNDAAFKRGLVDDAAIRHKMMTDFVAAHLKS